MTFSTTPTGEQRLPCVTRGRRPPVKPSVRVQQRIADRALLYGGAVTRLVVLAGEVRDRILPLNFLLSSMMNEGWLSPHLDLMELCRDLYGERQVTSRLLGLAADALEGEAPEAHSAAIEINHDELAFLVKNTDLWQSFVTGLACGEFANGHPLQEPDGLRGVRVLAQRHHSETLTLEVK